MSGNLEPGVHINSKKQTSQNPTKTTNKWLATAFHTSMIFHIFLSVWK
jgi:hypothetical protein